MVDKTEPTAKVANIISTLEDSSGNKIAQILAMQNEFVIYELDTPDVNNRLKVLIEGHSDESEKQIIKKFDAVKQKYVKSKGMLYRSVNHGVMKNRIAHALASCLSSEDPSFDGNAVFDTLCKEVEEEQKRIVTNRFLYLLPVVLSVAIWFVLSYSLMQQRVVVTPNWQIVSGFLASSLGAAVSIFSGVKKLHFEEFPYSRFYFFIGVERVLLGFVVGAAAYIAIKSGLLTSSLLTKSYWSDLMVFVAAGFSEHFIPSIIRKIDA